MFQARQNTSADDDGMSAYNVSEEAVHRSTFTSTAAFIAEHPVPFALISGFDVKRLWIDYMHVMDLGVSSDCVASVRAPCESCCKVFEYCKIFHSD